MQTFNLYFSESQSTLFEGDIVYDRTVDEVTGVDERTADEPYGDFARDAVRDRAYLWTTRIVPFEFTAGYSKCHKLHISNFSSLQ